MMKTNLPHSIDTLQISDLVSSNPVDITDDIVNSTFYSDVIISFTSVHFKGSFRIEYFPGM